VAVAAGFRVQATFSLLVETAAAVLAVGKMALLFLQRQDQPIRVVVRVAVMEVSLTGDQALLLFVTRFKEKWLILQK
tara:strand:- start:358 stop:588 length:231 start_codon:yes stop_codon:yes gene_type:complete